jgi:branched-chain amino acid transport system permease protein
MEDFVRLTITGLANGAILALAALGFVIIFKATGVVNFAQGQFLLIGAYLVYQFTSVWGWHWSVAVPAAILVSSLIGVLIERLVLRPLVGESFIAVIMVTIGLAGIMSAVSLGVWGTEPRQAPRFLPRGSLEVLGANVSKNRIIAIVIAALAIAAFSLFFKRSRMGIAMRAVADDQQAALVMGISVNRVSALSWALAAASAVLGGTLLSQITGVSQEVAFFGLSVFPVVILGGLDSLGGTVVGGAVVGLLITYTSRYVGHGLEQVVPFVVLVLILLVKPYGLFGQIRIERV